MIVFSSLTKIKKALQKGANANAVNSENHSALMLACRYRKAPVVKLLLDNGAEIGYYYPKHESSRHVPDRLHGVNAIMTAAYYNPDPEVIRLLVKHGAKVNSRARKGYSRNRNYTWCSTRMTPLMLACWHNNPEVISTLLEAGANPTLKGAFGDDIFYYLGKNPQIYGDKLKNKIKSLIKSRKYLNKKN
jgi:ankyrin repeat protein